MPKPFTATNGLRITVAKADFTDATRPAQALVMAAIAPRPVISPQFAHFRGPHNNRLMHNIAGNAYHALYGEVADFVAGQVVQLDTTHAHTPWHFTSVLVVGDNTPAACLRRLEDTPNGFISYEDMITNVLLAAHTRGIASLLIPPLRETTSPTILAQRTTRGVADFIAREPHSKVTNVFFLANGIWPLAQALEYQLETLDPSSSRYSPPPTDETDNS